MQFFRRADREPNDDSRLCSCHFKEGKKENNPTIFSYREKKQFNFPSPEKRVKRSKFNRLNMLQLYFVQSFKKNVPDINISSVCYFYGKSNEY